MRRDEERGDFGSMPMRLFQTGAMDRFPRMIDRIGNMADSMVDCFLHGNGSVGFFERLTRLFEIRERSVSVPGIADFLEEGGFVFIEIIRRCRTSQHVQRPLHIRSDPAAPLAVRAKSHLGLFDRQLQLIVRLLQACLCLLAGILQIRSIWDRAAAR